MVEEKKKLQKQVDHENKFDDNYYRRQADFEGEDDEEISGED